MKKQVFLSVLITTIAIFIGNGSLAQGQYALEWSEKENAQIIPYTRDCLSIFGKECQKVRLDSKNNVIVAGTSLETGNLNFLVTKYTNSGTLVWKDLIDVSNESKDYLTAIFIDSGDNIIITGFSQWSNNVFKSVIIKIDPEGKILWKNYFSDTHNWAYPHALAVDSNGDIFITGFIEVDKNQGFFVCKFDINGNFVWDDLYFKDVSGSYEGITLKVIDDSIFSFGYFFSSFPLDKRVVMLKHSKDGALLSSHEASVNGNFSTFHIDSQGNFYLGLFGDFKVIKYDQSGKEAWAFKIPTNLPNNVTADEVQDIISDENGNIYITGRYYGRHYEDTLKYTNGNLQVNKISPEGNLLYNYIYEGFGTNAFDGGNKLFLGKEGHLVIGGQSQRMYLGTDYDYVAIVLDNLGKPLDTLRYHEQGDDVIKSVVMDDKFNIYVAGIGGGSILTQKYSFLSTTGTNGIAKSENKSRVYPNPFTHNLYVDSGNTPKLNEFTLFDSKGTIVCQKLIDKEAFQILDDQLLPNGLYFYQIRSHESIESGKLIKN